MSAIQKLGVVVAAILIGIVVISVLVAAHSPAVTHTPTVVNKWECTGKCMVMI